MNQEDFKGLKRGDIIRHKTSWDGESIVVDANYGTSVTAVRTYHVSNPDEWEIIQDEKKTPSQRIYKDSSSFQEVATLEEGSAYTSLAIKINTIANILDEHEEKLRKYKYIGKGVFESD
jgi:hypothetical protein